MSNDGRMHERVQLKANQVGNELTGASHPNLAPDLFPLPVIEDPAGGNRRLKAGTKPFLPSRG